VTDIEDFLVRRNFRLAGIGDIFLLQFCDVATVAISHKNNYPILATGQRGKGKNSRILLSLGDILEFSL
jgi:hypothetical protein